MRAPIAAATATPPKKNRRFSKEGSGMYPFMRRILASRCSARSHRIVIELLTDQMRYVAIVLRADELEDLFLRREYRDKFLSERFCQGLGVLHGDFHFQVS